MFNFLTKFFERANTKEDYTERLSRKMSHFISTSSDVDGFLTSLGGKVDDIVKFVENQAAVTSIYVDARWFILTINPNMDTFKSETLKIINHRQYAIGSSKGRHVNIQIKIR